jgi:sugar phosphate isomerase/epimerase
MANWPIGLSTGCFYNRNILDCLPLIRESGFSMVEICSSPAHLDFHDLDAVRKASVHIHELGMEAYSFHAPFARHIDISSANESQRHASIAEIMQAAEAAALLRVHYFVLHPGPENAAVIPAGEQLAHMQNAISSLDRIVQRCRELGILCVLENKLPHLLFGNTSDILWILDGIKTAEVGACLDTGHAFLAGDMQSLVHKLAGHLKLIHAHDNVGSGDDHLPPGAGKIEWKKLLEDLRHIQFHGALILELAEGPDPAVTMANARRGRSYLRGISREMVLGVAGS